MAVARRSARNCSWRVIEYHLTAAQTLGDRQLVPRYKWTSHQHQTCTVYWLRYALDSSESELGIATYPIPILDSGSSCELTGARLSVDRISVYIIWYRFHSERNSLNLFAACIRMTRNFSLQAMDLAQSCRNITSWTVPWSTQICQHCLHRIHSGIVWTRPKR